MFGTMKKAMVVAAVVGISAVAPAVASADTWKANGATVGGAPGVAVTGTGSLGFTVNIGVPVTTTCNVQVTADLFNQGSPLNAHGQVTSFGVAAPTANCTVVGVPNCQVTNVATTALPWTIDTTGTSGTITGVNFTNTYGRINAANPCALEGNRVITGNVTGTWTNAPGRLTFTNATGLVVNGSLPTTVNGSVNLVGTGGQVISLS